MTASATALLTVAVFGLSTVAQAPQTEPTSPAGGQSSRPLYPAPTDLKVLPKTLTGEQVNEIMEQWESYLGVSCSTCHARDPKNLGPNGRPRMNYADDSKPEKSTARLMYTMTKDVNENYVSMVPTKDGAAAPTVTCGTCHRGKKDPEPFVISDDNPPSGASTPPAQK